MTRAELHKLLDEVPDARVDSVGIVLRRVVDDPEVERLLTIPWDDEPVSEEEDRLVVEARKEPSVPLDHLLRELDT
ncbi:MAG TPA: hypothetical protein VKK19_06850 [Candidatus Dormibacteraeota bacterium]|nr:hypothetical protein [Candidatus Dormibacteraeota bacterium]